LEILAQQNNRDIYVAVEENLEHFPEREVAVEIGKEKVLRKLHQIAPNYSVFKDGVYFSVDTHQFYITSQRNKVRLEGRARVVVAVVEPSFQRWELAKNRTYSRLVAILGKANIMLYRGAARTRLTSD
jgi:hypothetical protein